MQAYNVYFLISTFFVHCVRATPFDVTPDPVLHSNSSDCDSTGQCMEPASASNETKTQKAGGYLRNGAMFPVLTPVDCYDLLQHGYDQSGVYNIWPKNKIVDDRPIRVFCDMETDGGGWTVIQRRGNFLRPIDYFYKDWASYKSGFGNVEEEFWLGNDNIFALTNQRQYSVRFDLTDMKGDHAFARYDIFFIENEEDKYRLTIQDYSGTANDSMISHNGQKFTTKDQDNDIHKDNCAVSFKGGWWYAACHLANLNGLNFRGGHKSYADGINWNTWRGYHDSLNKTEIKIRPKNFLKSFWN